ncbi:hypothetical protein EYR40_000408 [Pleurotus pulmonarius]|nr:hypothetical protein EYR40_000408 [Pleurotus pulmonarius]
MSQLPNELLRDIVAHLERKTLLDLTIVSKRIHAMALPILYKDITFHLEDELPISLLRRDIQTNAGIQYTKAFAIYFFPCYFDDYDEIRADIDYIIPYLVNVRRLCLTRQCASPGVLSLLPTSARLTHLILDHTHCSEDLSQFLSCNPTLESIAIHNGDLVDGHVIELVARNLPKLYSLEIVLNDLVHIQSPMPSIINLGILDIESISASGFLLNFPSLRSLCLPESGLPAVLALAPFLPNIEFLEVYPMDQESRLIASDFAPFSKLKYVKYGMIIVRNSLPLELFDAVKSLVVVDAADLHTTSRWFRGSTRPLKHDTPGGDAYLWEGWWDYEEALIEEASHSIQSQCQVIPSQMPQLPNEILLAIVAHCLDRKTLLNLTVVSKVTNAMSLRCIYHDIALPFEDNTPSQISMLRRDVHTNPGVQFTTAFAIYFSEHCLHYEESRAHIEQIVPYLVNLKRLCLTRQATSPRVLSLLPNSVRLTHLFLDRTSSEGLSRFLLRHPTLESISLSNDDIQGHTIELDARDLPKLHSLAIAFDASVHITNPMPSVVNLSMLSCGMSCGHEVSNFPSLNSLSVQQFDLRSVLSLAPFLPNLQFLQVIFLNGDPPPHSSDFDKFSALIYVEYRGIIVEHNVVFDLFNAVQSLVVFEASTYYHTLCWERDFTVPIEEVTDNRDSLWEQWWERPKQLVEEASRRHTMEPELLRWPPSIPHYYSREQLAMMA